MLIQVHARPLSPPGAILFSPVGSASHRNLQQTPQADMTDPSLRLPLAFRPLFPSFLPLPVLQMVHLPVVDSCIDFSDRTLSPLRFPWEDYPTSKTNLKRR